MALVSRKSAREIQDAIDPSTELRKNKHEALALDDFLFTFLDYLNQQP
jgi:hypothetical protein